MNIELSVPVDVQVEITQECNQRCAHCYNYWFTNRLYSGERKSLSTQELYYITNELANNEIPYVTITGGEPFLRKEELFAFLEFLKKAGIRASINSNFSVTRLEDLKLIAEKYPTSILVSILSYTSKCKYGACKK